MAVPAIRPAAPATAAELARHSQAQWRGRAALAVALVALVGFAVVLALVLLGDTAALDLSVSRGVQRADNPLLFRLLLAVSWPGFQPQATVIGLLVVVVLYWRRLRLEGAFALLALASVPFNSALKPLAHRARPSAGADGLRVYGHIGGDSFPSGHVLTYVLFCGFLAYLAYTLIERAAPRRALLALLVGLIVLVGPSRIYLGQHWFTDVLASYFLGTALLLALLAGYRRAKERQARSRVEGRRSKF
jgi:membrane-associated phospholipid phosphatase